MTWFLQLLRGAVVMETATRGSPVKTQDDANVYVSWDKFERVVDVARDGLSTVVSPLVRPPLSVVCWIMSHGNISDVV